MIETGTQKTGENKVTHAFIFVDEEIQSMIDGLGAHMERVAARLQSEIYPAPQLRNMDNSGYNITTITEAALVKLARDLGQQRVDITPHVHRYVELYQASETSTTHINIDEVGMDAIDAIGRHIEGSGVKIKYLKTKGGYNYKLVAYVALAYCAALIG